MAGLLLKGCQVSSYEKVAIPLSPSRFEVLGTDDDGLDVRAIVQTQLCMISAPLGANIP